MILSTLAAIAIYLCVRTWWISQRLSFYKIHHTSHYVLKEVKKICWFDHPLTWNFKKILRVLEKQDVNLHNRYFVNPDELVHEYVFNNLRNSKTGEVIKLKVGILPAEEENAHWEQQARIKAYAKECAEKWCVTKD